MPRPRKPAELRLLEGNPGRRPVRVGPRPAEGVGPCPAGESAAVQRYWRRLRREWSLLLTAQDRDALRDYCRLSVMAEAVWAAVQHEGPLAPDGDRRTLGRALRGWLTLQAERRKMQGEFGATPATRGRVSGGMVIGSGAARRTGPARLLTGWPDGPNGPNSA